MIQSLRRSLSILASNTSSDVTLMMMMEGTLETKHFLEDLHIPADFHSLVTAHMKLPDLMMREVLVKHCAAGTAAAAGYSI